MGNGAPVSGFNDFPMPERGEVLVTSGDIDSLEAPWFVFVFPKLLTQ
jgi:hypothetical protein